ncbi:site-specific DNA-methyltransferase [bacterium]|nr:site-specific DNA-methyltransferase [bacterium]
MIQLVVADARRLPFPDASAQTCITSPPYYGLRDYGTATWEGGDPKCDHRQEQIRTRGRGRDRAASGGTFHDSPAVEPALGLPYRELCAKCGAVRIDRQIGLERTPEEYVATLVECFREVRRVLKDDGTLWLNLGDSYATGGGSVGERPGGGKQGESWRLRGLMTPPNRMPLPGLKPKDLIGIPWRVAFALQADGWYLRSDVIWSKPNPMPESVTDRPTKAHEHLFLLAKSERYYYDKAAICEPYHAATLKRGRSIRQVAADGHKTYRFNGEPLDAESVKRGRNARTVWTIPTCSYRGSHFAVMPEALVEPCILAGSRPGDTVLDPFCGTATVGRVALRHGRRFLGADINPKYLDELARERTSNLQLALREVASW